MEGAGLGHAWSWYQPAGGCPGLTYPADSGGLGGTGLCVNKLGTWTCPVAEPESLGLHLSVSGPWLGRSDFSNRSSHFAVGGRSPGPCLGRFQACWAGLPPICPEEAQALLCAQPGGLPAFRERPPSWFLHTSGARSQLPSLSAPALWAGPARRPRRSAEVNWTKGSSKRCKPSGKFFFSVPKILPYLFFANLF